MNIPIFLLDSSTQPTCQPFYSYPQHPTKYLELYCEIKIDFNYNLPTNPTPHTNLKLLFISADKFPPFRVDVSVLFGKEIVGRGHAIDWLLQSDKPIHRAYQTHWSGCKVLVGPKDKGTSIISGAKNHFYSIFHDFKMFRIIKNSGYHLIIIKDKFISGLMAIAASRLYGIKFIYWLSFPFPEDFLLQVQEGVARFPLLNWIRGQIFAFLLYRILIPFSDHTFVQTEHMRKNISQKGIPKEKMTAVPMAVSIKDTPFFGYDPQQSYKQRKTVVYIGSLQRNRKMDFLLRSFKKVLKKEKDARLQLVGGSKNHADEEFLKSEAKRLRIDHAVRITGFLPQNKAWQYVKEAAICVSPIYPAPIFNCGSPTKLIEYMAMGKAVVANDHPEQRLVISESKAGICVPYEETAFAEGILYLLENPSVAKQMGIRGRRYIEKKRNYEHAADLVETKLLEISQITKLS